jgi:predicted amidohydrolase
MFSTGFVTPINTKDDIYTHRYAEDISFCKKIAATYTCVVCAGSLKYTDGKFYNSIFFITPDGKILYENNKTFLFSPGGETKPVTSGLLPDICKTNEYVLQAAVCYDLRFPELFRYGVRKGVQIISVHAQWPEHRLMHWEVLLCARAIENQAYVIGINGMGPEDKNTLAGNSCVYDPSGKLILTCNKEEGLFNCVLDLKHVTDYRKKFPVLPDIGQFNNLQDD